MYQLDELQLRSTVFPALTLLDSYYDRDVTRLSDRGLASNMIGDRWSDLAAEEINSWVGNEKSLPDGTVINVQQVFQLDAIPQIAMIASRRKLQNPDFIVAGTIESAFLLMAVDAKFSIETAKPPQVTADTLRALLNIGDPIAELVPSLAMDSDVRGGFFISPDMPLTHYVMDRRRGRLATQVGSDQVLLAPMAPVAFLKPLEGSRLIGVLANRDGFRNEIRNNSLLAMYYFRLVRACYGAYQDITAPIFGPASASEGTEADLESRTLEFARTENSAWDIVLRWDALAEEQRRQKESLYASMPFPLANKDVRDRIDRESVIRGLEAPSVNNVRRRLGGWYRSQFDERLGVVLPPVEDIASVIQKIQHIAAEVDPLVELVMDEIIEEVFAAQPQRSSETV